MIELIVTGNLGKDATLSQHNGNQVINFSVAHTVKYKKQSGEQVEKTTWVDCSYWIDRTGLAEYLKKGTKVLVKGEPSVRAFTTQSGSSGAALALRVGFLELLGRPQQNQGEQRSFKDEPNNEVPDNVVDDLPF